LPDGAHPVPQREHDALDALDAAAMVATLCYMDTITHREMRNHSAEVLRRVANGESLRVTNNGADVAVISPAPLTEIERLADCGQVRRALTGPAALRSIVRKQAPVTSAELLRDVRGRW
jgi:prevent-host-death family protein